jgi:hypothetical protein
MKKVICTKEDDTLRFDSQSEAARHFLTDESNIRYYIKNNLLFNGYSITVGTDDFNSVLEDECDKLGIDPKDVSQVWYKSKHISINQKNNTEFSVDDFLDKVDRILLNKIEKHKYNGPIIRGNTAIICWTSDRHIGALTESNSIYTNEYNTEEYNRRNTVITNKLIEEIDNHNDYTEVYIVDLGDMTDGYDGNTMRMNHKLPQNLSTTEQFEVALQSFIEQVQHLVYNYPGLRINYIFQCNSNHSANVDYMVAKSFQLYCNKFPTVTVDLTQLFLDTFEVFNHTFIYTHGKDDKQMKNGLPTVLDSKTEVFVNDYIMSNYLTGNIHFVKGDKHTSNEHYGKHFRYKNILSVYGGSKWVATNFGSCKSGFIIEKVNNDNNEVESKTIFFDGIK